MEFFRLSALSASFVTLILAFFVLLHGRRSPVCKIWALVNVTVEQLVAGPAV